MSQACNRSNDKFHILRLINAKKTQDLLTFQTLYYFIIHLAVLNFMSKEVSKAVLLQVLLDKLEYQVISS